MWDLLKHKKNECDEFHDELEHLGSELSGSADGDKLLTQLSPPRRIHYAGCGNCREAAEYFLESRQILAGLAVRAPVAGPWFAQRVLAAIDAQEKVFAIRESLWSAVPQYATRLAWVTAIVLLAATTWLFEKQISRQVGSSTNEEFLSGSPAPQPSQDDVLVSLAERNQ
jgi:hypothetical protein